MEHFQKRILISWDSTLYLWNGYIIQTDNIRYRALQASLLKYQQCKYKCIRAWDVPVLLTSRGRCARTGMTEEVKGNMTRQIQEKHSLIQMLIDLGPLFLNGVDTSMQVSLTSGVPLAGFGETDSFISLEQSQMHPPPTKPSQLVPEIPQTLKQHNSQVLSFKIPHPLLSQKGD